MLLERQYHLHAEPNKRTNVRHGYADGFNKRTLKTRPGTIERTIPRVRGNDEPFRPASLDAAMAPEKRIRIALAEMTIDGGAASRIKDILESLCGSRSKWSMFARHFVN